MQSIASGQDTDNKSKQFWIYLSQYDLEKSSTTVAGNKGDLHWFANEDFSQVYSPYEGRTVVLPPGTAPTVKDPLAFQRINGTTLFPIKAESLRNLWNQGDKVNIAVVSDSPVDPAKACTDESNLISIQETERSTAFRVGATSVLKAIFPSEKKAAAIPPGAKLEFFCVSTKSATLKSTRAHFEVTGGEKKGETTTLDVITGPSEHWFLSGDVITRKAKQLKYDFDKKMISEKDKPSAIYLGINYMIGDVYSRQTGWLSTDRIILRGQISASKSPFDSYGVGLGYRLADFSDAKTNGGFLIFASKIWTKPDTTNSPPIGIDKKSGWHFGLGYSVDSAIGWLGK